MIKIYGPKASTAGRCLWAAEEMAIPYESVPVDMQAKEHKTPEFLAMNPNGKVPVMKDGDLVLWESFAINIYLARTYQPEFLGQDPAQEAQGSQWMCWALANLAYPFEVLATQKWRKAPDDAITQAMHEQIDRFLPILEKQLQGKTFLTGGNMTVADVCVGGIVSDLDWLGWSFAAYPELTRWTTTLTSRPAYLKIFPNT